MSCRPNSTLVLVATCSRHVKLTHRSSLPTGISSLKAEKGLALQDIIQGIYDFAQTIEFSAPTRVYFLDQIAQVECVSFTLNRGSGASQLRAN